MGNDLEKKSKKKIIEKTDTSKKRKLVNNLNDLSAKEWIQETISVWNQKGLGANHPDAQIEKLHPAPFSYTDVSRLIRFFTKSGECVLDPFLGIGSTLKACAIEGRKGIGFELNEKYCDLSKERLQKEVNSLFSNKTDQKIINGDSRLLVKQLKKNTLDFVVTSPPYFNILHKKDHKVKSVRVKNNLDTQYSDSNLDLGNLNNYKEFLEELSLILGNCSGALKPNKYMALIVSDFRDKDKYIMFHSDLAMELQKYSLILKGIIILYQRHKKIFPYGYPYSFVPNIHHQYILLLQNKKKND